MHYTNGISGTPSQHDRPAWEPLVDLLGPDLAGWFMWMCEIKLGDGCGLHAYKHVATRRYLHLASDGRAFLYSTDAPLPRGPSATRDRPSVLGVGGPTSATR